MPILISIWPPVNPMVNSPFDSRTQKNTPKTAVRDSTDCFVIKQYIIPGKDAMSELIDAVNTSESPTSESYMA